MYVATVQFFGGFDIWEDLFIQIWVISGIIPDASLQQEQSSAKG